MKAIDYLSSLIAGQKMGSSIPVQVCELEMLKTYLEIQQTMAEGRAALANAEPKKFSLTNTSTGTLPQRVESIFEAMDKEVAAGRLVRTGPMEWTKL